MNKSITKDYNRVVKPSQERWLGLIRDKLVAHSYNSAQEMMDDVEGIVQCARRYHGSKTSLDRNVGKLIHSYALAQAWRDVVRDVMCLTYTYWRSIMHAGLNICIRQNAL